MAEQFLSNEAVGFKLNQITSHQVLALTKYIENEFEKQLEDKTLELPFFSVQ